MFAQGFLGVFYLVLVYFVPLILGLHIVRKEQRFDVFSSTWDLIRIPMAPGYLSTIIGSLTHAFFGPSLGYSKKKTRVDAERKGFLFIRCIKIWGKEKNINEAKKK
jgi:hypothetical protein